MNVTLPTAAWVVFDKPLWLAAGLAALLVPAAGVWFARRGRRIGLAGIVLQCLALLALAAALARPRLPFTGKAQTPYLLLRDVSASTREQRNKILSWPDGLRREEFDFAVTVVPRGLSRDKPIDDNQTMLAPALRLASGKAKEIAGVLIRTDGRFMDEDWRPAAEALGRTGLNVFILPMSSPPGDARIADLSTSRQADGKVKLDVTVASTALQRRTLTVRRKGGPVLLERELRLLAGETETFHLTDSPPSGDKTVEYAAAVSAGDEFLENDTAGALVLPGGQRIAVVPRGALPGALHRKLAADVVELSPTEAPTSPRGWLEYSAVILLDATGTLLPKIRRSALAEYVRNGGGLVLIGTGPHADPGDRDDPLNQVAALVANPYERRPMKVTIVLDASGSMAEPVRLQSTRRIKFDLACEAVLSLKRHLTVRDALAIITFAEQPRKIYDSGGSQAEFTAAADALGGVRPAGPTKVVAALLLACSSPPPAGRDGLVLLISDLQTADKDFHPAALADALRKNRWSLAVVATATAGKTPAEKFPLQQLAQQMHALLVYRADMAGLAKVFARFLRNRRGDAVRRGKFQATAGRSLFGVDPQPLPPVGAYILAAVVDKAPTLARVGADPLIARRRVGLGRSVSVALPLTDASNAAWRNSPRAADVLAAAVRWASRSGAGERFFGQITRRANTLHIQLQADAAVSGRLVAQVYDASCPQKVREIPLRQIGPRRFEGEIPAGDASLAIFVRDDKGRTVWRQAVGKTCPREFADTGAEWDNLRALARLTGGQIITDTDLPLLRQKHRLQYYLPIWPYLLALAIALMLLEWAMTRVIRRGS